jgi:hypothetical protein
MKIAVITIARNEEKIIPFFIKHYSTIASHIFLINNESDDNMVSVAKTTAEQENVPLTILDFVTGGFDEQWFTALKTNAYKTLAIDYDLVIQVDPDELIYHRSIPTKLFLTEKVREGYSFFKPNGYQMTDNKFPEYTGIPIVELVKYGCLDTGFSKPVVFSPKYVFQTTFGFHNTQLLDLNGESISPYQENDFLLLHYKFLGIEHRLERIKSQKNRLSEFGKLLVDNGIACQLNSSNSALAEEFNHFYSRRELVL